LRDGKPPPAESDGPAENTATWIVTRLVNAKGDRLNLILELRITTLKLVGRKILASTANIEGGPTPGGSTALLEWVTLVMRGPEEAARDVLGPKAG
jgi:hypothetical protein